MHLIKGQTESNWSLKRLPLANKCLFIHLKVFRNIYIQYRHPIICLLKANLISVLHFVTKQKTIPALGFTTFLYNCFELSQMSFFTANVLENKLKYHKYRSPPF